MNDDIINRYTLMLIKQYWEKKNARSEIKAMLRHWQIIADFIRNPDNFDLDRVTGYRLDVIGRIVGLPRSVPAVIARVFFGFDGHLNTAGFDSKSNAAYDFTVDSNGYALITMGVAMSDYQVVACEGQSGGWLSNGGIYSFFTSYGCNKINASQFSARSTSWRSSDKNFIAQPTVGTYIAFGRI